MRAALLAAGAIACGCNLAAATETLDETLVLGRREPAPLAVSSAAGTHYAISREDIARANARSLDEVLQRLPGVNVRVGGDGTPRIDMRGLRTRQVKILINGIPVNSVGDGNFDQLV